jgi:hypothetical protein
MRRSSVTAAFAAVALSIGFAQGALAVPIVGATISSDGTMVDNAPWNLGYSFTVMSAANVVSLGVWDDLADGLISSHRVGLWSSGGILLTSALVPSGTAGILDAGFRFVDIGPLALAVGQIYYVAATFNGPGDDTWTVDPSSLVMAPQITYDSRRYQFGSALVFPDLAGSNTTGYWGGNIRLEEDTAAVPEPSSLLLVGGGLALTRLRRRFVRPGV